MRNREIIEYLLYPKFFNAHSVLYKGTYCVSFSLHTLTKGKTTTHAYPFLVHNPAPLRHADLKEHPALHADGNFSFLTHKYPRPEAGLKSSTRRNARGSSRSASSASSSTSPNITRSSSLPS
jgi:hypothetical protein